MNPLLMIVDGPRVPVVEAEKVVWELRQHGFDVCVMCVLMPDSQCPVVVFDLSKLPQSELLDIRSIIDKVVK